MSTPIYIRELGGSCPYQAYGAFYGNPFYFRARHGTWHLSVAKPGENPVMTSSLFYFDGVDASGGFMNTSEALAAIGKAFEAFTDKYADQIYKGADYPPEGGEA